MPKTLILQFIIQQWDKAQRTQQHIEARRAVPDRYSVKVPPAKYLCDDRIIVDQHGDDRLGNRLQYQLIDMGILIDHFRLNLNSQTVEFKNDLTTSSEPVNVTTLENNWQQFQYQWRYRVEEGGYIYWLYEAVTLNACFAPQFKSNIFVEGDEKALVNKLLMS